MAEVAYDLAPKAGQAWFGQYGKHFQEKIFQALIGDIRFASQMIEVMHPDFFELKYLSYLTEKYFSYRTKYKSFPTLKLLVSIVRDDLTQDSTILLREQVVEFLHRLKSNPDLGDQKYVKEKSLDFCKTQAFKEALEQSVDLIATEKFESVLTLMKSAVSMGMANTTGHDFFNDMDARFKKSNRIVVPTGIIRLDSHDIFRGGLGKGEIGVVTANTGVGKSHWLVQMGVNAMLSGRNVVHYTFELSEESVGIRYDSCITGIASNEIVRRKDEVKEFYDNKEMGRLFIKEYPTGSASVVTVKNHLDKLLLKDFKPHLIIVDYADIMRSTRSFDSLRHELKLVYEELRNMAMEMNIPIWTASQANRDSANSDIVGLENMAEAYGKAMVADVVVSISRKATEKAGGTGRLYIAKNRAGRDGLLFPIAIDTARSRFELMDENHLTLNEALKEDENELKSRLREKWKDIRNI